jgi:Fe2+ transport system protein FeoA
MQTLFSLSESQEAVHSVIHHVSANGKTKAKLLGLGLGVGQDIDVIRNRRGDIVLRTGQSRISIGQSLAEKIMVMEA